jgi:alcohol dehydrogenase class IV
LEAYGASAWRKLHRLAIAASVSSEEDSDKIGAEKMIRAIRALNARLQIPKTLSGIRREDIPALARHAEKEANPLYPVPRLMTAKELEQFYFAVLAEEE